MKKQELLFAIHPVLHELKVNEDGTVIIWKDKVLKVTKYQRSRDNYNSKMVHFNSTTQRVAKVVCEAWHGMREGDQVVRRKENFDNDHFSNLYWSENGKPSCYKNKLAKRSKLSKIKPEDVDTILNRIKLGDTLAEIATDYHTTGMSIYRLKKRHQAID